ncbi:hypothetical protein [Deinococcus aquiradiocola]|nr:hypothetical protein [Deinococcus aquiradiocola]
MLKSDRPSVFRRPALWGAALAVLLVLGGALLWLGSRQGPVALAGESEASTAPFTLRAGRYDVRADLLPECQYTFYLTPVGGEWSRAGKTVGAASGERELRVTTDALPGGRYFVHGFTAPEEGCSWTLRLDPRAAD